MIYTFELKKKKIRVTYLFSLNSRVFMIQSIFRLYKNISNILLEKVVALLLRMKEISFLE